MKSLYSIKSFYKACCLIIKGVFFTIAITQYITAAEPAKPSTKPGTKETAPKSSVDPSDPKNPIYLDTKGKAAGTGDPTKSGPASEAAKLGAGWHPAALASAVLPKDRYGLVDWARSVKDNVIAPKHSIDPAEQEMPPLDMNVVIETKSDFINNVVYPHYIHTWWLKCEVCHPKIFVPTKGQNHMTMVEIAEGKFCGRCHGKVAFPLTDCNRCHTQPKKAAQR